MRRAARVDRNQPEIVKAMRDLGACVVITSQLKNAFDVLVIYNGKVFIMEIKDGAKKKLTDGESKCAECVNKAGGIYHVVDSVETAINILTGKK